MLALSAHLPALAAGADKDPEAPAEQPAQTIMLPAPGAYRAPGILRLAGKLRGLPVKVEQRKLNDEKITISRQLGHRPVTLDELIVLLASQSFYLHVWDHPRHGKLLVASKQKDWKPENLRFHKILKVGLREFDHVWICLLYTSPSPRD